MTLRLLLILTLALPIFAWRLNRPGFSDTEGMYAEPAREMVVTGDWITPRMNGEPFLTKPPLMYWLSAALFAGVGPTEYARLWPVLAAVATVAVTGALGAELFGESAGVLAALVLATSLGVLVEARLLRADMVLVLALTLTLYGYVRLRRGGGTAAASTFWTAVGIGLLDKGFLAVLLPGGVIALAEIAGGDLRLKKLSTLLRAFHVPLGLVVLTVLTVPWHALAAVRNPGFLWDYVVNQHLLFFFDAKLPRDSIPDSLGFFWLMFSVRTLPWSLLLPAALLHGWRTAHHRRAVRLPIVWIAVVLGFFSLAASRLEHYSLPALPAVALLIGALLADVAVGRVEVGRAWFIVPPAAAALVALAAMTSDVAALIDRLDPTLSRYGVISLAMPAALTAAVGFGMLAFVLAMRRARAAALVGAATAVVLFGFVQVAHERVEPLFSWRPFAVLIGRHTKPGSPIFFRASAEYQLCGGLDYYMGRYVRLLPPPGWVPPTFLAGRTNSLFASWDDVAPAWRSGTAVFVSDDIAEPGDERALVPGSYVVLARAGSRVLLGTGVSVAGDNGSERRQP